MSRPRATYRLQLHRGFDFEAAARIAPYLARLGISHVYTSPYLQARPGSTHGYDIVNHARLNPELGDRAAFDRMTDAFEAAGLGHIVDLVPNHMAVGGSDNPLWLDVLEWGQESPYAGWFDIDWEPHNRYLIGKVLVPLLGDQYGVELAAGRLQLKFDAEHGEFAVWAYGVHKLPVCPLHYGLILRDTPALEALGDDFAALEDWRPDVRRRALVLKQQLAQLAAQSDCALALDRALQAFNDVGDGVARTALHELIQRQHWRASHFRVAGDDINYRRFFNVNELAGLRIELPAVFEHTHQLVLELVRAGRIHGLRVDHIDGLLDPAEYLASLRQACAAAGADSEDEPFYLIVEKILAADETLPPDWPVQGTTGYDFSDLCLQLLIDPESEGAFTDCYQSFVGSEATFGEVLRDSKIRVMEHEMAAELHVLSRAAARIARMSALTADFTSGLLLRAIRAVIACMPVYRTYVHAASVPSLIDLQRLGAAIEAARRYDREIDPSVFTFLERLLTGQLAEPRSGYIRHKVLWCAMRMQQYSGPVMAKGQEDTAFYRYHRFIALNEVGSVPSQWGLDLDAWHQAMSARARAIPDSMLATSTHDTKRGEDVRARLAVLSELPGEWQQHVTQWQSLLATVPGADTLDSNDLYALLQTLLGTCPAAFTARTATDEPELVQYRDRVRAAVLKSLREAKVRTTWNRPDDDYEAQVDAWVQHTLSPALCPAFWDSFAPFLQRIAALGVANSLALVTLKLTAPGIPDIYQGSEGWNFSLMDPDNRRPVDYDLRSEQLHALPGYHATSTWLRARMQDWHDGAIKLHVTHVLLQLRRAYPDLFRQGGYRPLSATGRLRHAACIFVRQHAGIAMVVIVGRFPAATAEGWQDTQLQLPADLPSHWTDVLSGRQFASTGSLRLQELLTDLPVAVLLSPSSSGV